MSFLIEFYRLFSCRTKVTLWMVPYQATCLEHALDQNNVVYRSWRSHYDPVEPWAHKIKTSWYFRRPEDAILFKLEHG